MNEPEQLLSSCKLQQCFLSPNNIRDVYVYRDIKHVLHASQLTNIQ